jgi:hypothetical protein
VEVMQEDRREEVRHLGMHQEILVPQQGLPLEMLVLAVRREQDVAQMVALVRDVEQMVALARVRVRQAMVEREQELVTEVVGVEVMAAEVVGVEVMAAEVEAGEMVEETRL